MNIQKEIKKIQTVVTNFEKLAKQSILQCIDGIIKSHPQMSITITDSHLIISDYVDGEQVDFMVYISEDVTDIEATKNGESVGYLEHDSQTYIKYLQMIRPIVDVYNTYFSWDGQEFVTNMRK